MITKHTHNQTHTVLIADRDFPARMGLLTILAGEPNLIVPAPSQTLTELTALASQHHPALILMDTQFADGDGTEACRRLIAQHEGVRVLFFANSATPKTVMQALDAGAAGLLLKTVTREELLAGVRQVLAGQSVVDQTLMSETLKWAGEQQRSPGTTFPHLSPRHQQILPLLSEGLTNKEISARLNLSEKTIKNYLADLFDRLQMSRRSQVAAWFISHAGQTEQFGEPSRPIQQTRRPARRRLQHEEELVHAHHSSY